MSSTEQTITNLAEKLQLKNTFTFTLNSEVTHFITEFLDMNFSIIKQCLHKITELENTVTNNGKVIEGIDNKVDGMKGEIERIGGTSEKHEVRIEKIEKELLVIGEEISKKGKTDLDLESILKQLENADKYVTKEQLEIVHQDITSKFSHLNTLYAPLQAYTKFTETTNQNLETHTIQIENLQSQLKTMENKISTMDSKIDDFKNKYEQLDNMMKEIDLTGMHEKMRKFKEEIDTKIDDMQGKLKRKVGSGELHDLEKSIIERLDIYLTNLWKEKADLGETKDALSFLEKRLNELEENTATNEEGEFDPLFAKKKWNCASCTKDLGKFESKLEKFKPWSVFPCKELDPEKTGGYGYINYVDKVAYKKGLSVDDNGLERLNKTFFLERGEKSVSPKKLNSTRATNFMSSYGTSEKKVVGLKDEYFKVDKLDKLEKGDKTEKVDKMEKGLRFRMKGHMRKESLTNPEKVKEI